MLDIISHLIQRFLFPAAIGAIGNRTWGDAAGSHWAGAAVMTLAKITAEPQLWKWSIVIYALILFFRAWPVSGWLTATYPLYKRILRSLALIPLPVGLYLMGGDIFHLYAIIPGVVIVSLGYYLADKQKKFDPVVIGELVAGVVVGDV